MTNARLSLGSFARPEDTPTPPDKERGQAGSYVYLEQTRVIQAGA